MSNPEYLIIGGGGHAAALAEILIKQNKPLLGVVAPNIDEIVLLGPDVSQCIMNNP